MRLGLFLALAVGGTGLVLALLLWLFPTFADFRPGNPLWNGLAHLQRDYGARPLPALSGLPLPGEGHLLLLVPYRPPREEEVEILRRFLGTGGTLLLADDFGFGNAVLEGLGLPARFAGVPLLDPLFHGGQPWLPEVVRMEPIPLTRGLRALALNQPTALKGEGFVPLAWSSPFSFLDLDGDRSPDPEEPFGPYPVLGQAGVGQGTLLLLADPSLFINRMLVAGDNARFVRRLFEGRSVWVATEFMPRSRLDRTRDLAQRVRSALEAPLARAGLLLALVGLSLLPYRRLWKEERDAAG